MSGVNAELKDIPAEDRLAVLKRSTLISVIAFLTLIDLFGSQALLPTLVEAYGVSRSAMGFAVNASTIGMAAASLAVAALSHRIDRKRGIWISLALLSIPTFLLGFTVDLTTFTLLRIGQGIFMSMAFTLTLTYLSEECPMTAIAGAMAAYITGNVASNLIGRFMASGVADTFGLTASFTTFAILNLAGAAVAYASIGSRSGPRTGGGASRRSVVESWGAHFADARLRSAFLIGFIILFVFVATFTYANFVIAAPPFSLPQMNIGYVYFVFLPAILTTPLAAHATRSYGARRTFFAAMGVSIIGLALTATPIFALVLIGMALVGAGLFFGQSVATAYVGRTAKSDHAAANGLYLASYYLGGIAGAAILGQVFEAQGWTVSIAIMAALILAAVYLARVMDA
ncbi:MAG: MFS transporter [Rhodomicrobium sp.]|nr:MFS transporter [Rhodomicrobium sp.]